MTRASVHDRRRTSTPDVSVVSSAHDVADARLHRLVAAFLRAGLRVEVSALGSAADGPAGSTIRVSRFGRAPAPRLLRALSAPLRAHGRVLVVLDPDALPAALVARALRRRRVVADVHEDYLALVQDRPWTPAKRRVAALVAQAAQRCSRWADVTSVADEHVPPRVARCRIVVRNVPDVRLLPAEEPASSPRAVYVGDVRRSRGLHLMLEALEQAPDWSLDLVGPVAPADAPELQDWQRRSPAAARLRVHGRLTPERSWAVAAGAWAGFALLEDTPAFRDAVPTKLYEYLGSGIPVLVTPLPRQAAIVRASAAGAIVGSPDEAATTLRAWGRDRERILGLRSAALAWSDRHLAHASPYDRLAALVCELARESSEGAGDVRAAAPGAGVPPHPQ